MKLNSLLAVMVVALGLVGAASAAGSPLRAGDAVVTGRFAGRAEGAVVGVAVVAEKPAADGQPRKISVYVCNGSSLAVWLTGLTAGNVADLKSADGRSGVHVELAAQTASGKVGLAGGSGFRFTVPRALGIAGLFDVSVAANGLVRGTSSTGGSLTGQAGAVGRLPARGTVVATVTAAGQDVKLTAPARHLTPGSYRWIVLANRMVWGANTLGPIRGGIGVFLRPTGGKQTRIKAGSAGQQGYDDDTCGRLAAHFNSLNAQYERAVASGTANGIVAQAVGAAAQNILDELDDHCLIAT